MDYIKGVLYFHNYFEYAFRTHIHKPIMECTDFSSKAVRNVFIFKRLLRKLDRVQSGAFKDYVWTGIMTNDTSRVFSPLVLLLDVFIKWLCSQN